MTNPEKSMKPFEALSWDGKQAFTSGSAPNDDAFIIGARPS